MTKGILSSPLLSLQAHLLSNRAQGCAQEVRTAGRVVGRPNGALAGGLLTQVEGGWSMPVRHRVARQPARRHHRGRAQHVRHRRSERRLGGHLQLEGPVGVRQGDQA